MPSRLPFLLQAVESLEGQLDRLYICLNDFKTLPDELKRPGLYPFIPETDFGSIGRFLFTDWLIPPYYYFCMDDDIYYPPDYISYQVAKIEQYHRSAVVSLHGRILPKEIKHWNNCHKIVFRCLYDSVGDAWAHICGTGVMGFHSDTLRISVRDFPHLNYDDFEFSIILQQRKIPVLIASHEEGFLYYLGVPTQETIFWQTMYIPKLCEELTRIANSLQWQLYSSSA